MSASSNLLKSSLPSTGNNKSTLPAGKATQSASASLLQAAGVNPNALAYVPESEKPKVEKKATLGEKIKKGAVDVVKGIVEPVATLVARPIQLGAELAGVSDERVNEITDKFGGFVARTPQNFGDVKKDVGRGIQTVALGIPGSTLGKTVAGGAAFGTGASLEEGNDLFSKETLGSAAIGAGAGLVLHGAGKVLQKTLGRGKKAIQTAVEDSTPVVEDVVQKPLTATERLAKYSREQGYEPITPDSNLPTIDAGPGAPKSTLPTVQVGETPARRVPGDFTYEPIKQPTNVPTRTPEFHPDTGEVKVNPQAVQDAVKVLDKELPEKVKSGTHEQYAQAFERDLVSNPQLVEDIAMGKKAHPEGVPADAYLSLLSNEAERTGNAALIDKLSNSKVSSMSGTKLEANKLKSENNIVDIVRDIKESRVKQLTGTTTRSRNKELNNLSQKIKDLIEPPAGFKPTRQAILEALDDLVCK